MLSLPLKKQMTKMELFTQWSSLIMYLPVGVLAMTIPGLLAAPLALQSSQYRDGLIRLLGMQLTLISFLYFIFSRVRPSSASQAVILGTTFERIVYVTGCCYVIYARQLIPGLLVLMLVAVDTGLSIVTLIIWFKTSDEASVKNYWCFLLSLMSLKCKKNLSSYIVQLLGLVQYILAIVFVIYPESANQVLQFNKLHIPNEQGLLLMNLLASGALGCIQFSFGGVDNRACNIATVFYRVFFSIPLAGLLLILQQVPEGLVGYALCLDVVNVVLSSLVFLIKNKQE